MKYNLYTRFHFSIYVRILLLFSSSVDYTCGIFQSIGFKEFHNYLLLSEEKKQTQEGQDILKQS